MASKGSLENVRHKFDRSAHHFGELTAEMDRYFSTNPCEILSDPNSNPDAPFLVFDKRVRPPTSISLIIGDVLQNLRSCLDYLVWELVLAAGKDPGNRHMFPICTSKPTCFKRALEKGQLDHVDPAAIALIEGLQPNVRGDELSCKFDPLYVLDELTNMNKHRHLILTAMRGAMAQDIGNGAVAIVDDDAQRIAGIRGSDVKVDTQVVATISFANGPVEGKEVSNTLCWLADYVSFDVIPLFREFFK